MGRINSKAKGSRGERLFRDLLILCGFTARRGQQFSGDPSAPDVISNVEGIHWEVKHVEKLNIWSAMEQAIEDCGKQMPVVAHKINRKEWLCTLRGVDFLHLMMRIKHLSECPTPTVPQAGPPQAG